VDRPEPPGAPSAVVSRRALTAAQRQRRREWRLLGGLWCTLVALGIGSFLALLHSCELSLGSRPDCERAEERLVKAATAGDVVSVRERLDRGDPIEGGSTGPRPLHCAIEYAHTDVADVLVQRGAWTGSAADLDRAASSGQVEVVRLLLDHGAPVDAGALERLAGSDYCGLGGGGLALGRSTPAERQAATPGQAAEMMGLLLDHGADPNGRPDSISPLLWATFTQNDEEVFLLLARGASVDRGGPVDRLQLTGAAAEAQSGFCFGALLYPPTGYEAVRQGTYGPASSTTVQPSVVGSPPLPTSVGSSMLPLFPIEYVPASGVDNVTPLTAAALKGDTGLAQALLDHGADPNAAAGGLVTPLYGAAVRGDDAMVRLLMAHGASATPPTDQRVMTPAEVAVRAGHPATALLIAQLSSPSS